MSKLTVAEAGIFEPRDKPARKRWSPPRVIVSEVDSTEAGVVNVPEASSGLLVS